MVLEKGIVLKIVYYIYYKIGEKVWVLCYQQMLLTDLSKAFDCIRHDLLIAKFHAYGWDQSSLRYMYDYLSCRKQRVRINNTFSECNVIKYGAPQGSILGPLLFNIYIYILQTSFFSMNNVN